MVKIPPRLPVRVALLQQGERELARPLSFSKRLAVGINELHTGLVVFRVCELRGIAARID